MINLQNNQEMIYQRCKQQEPSKVVVMLYLIKYQINQIIKYLPLKIIILI